MTTVTQEDFKQEGPHQWTLNRGNYRVVVRQVDGLVDIDIRAKIEQDPSSADWREALMAINAFYDTLRIAESRE